MSMVDGVRERESKKWCRLCSDNWRLREVAWNSAETSPFHSHFLTHPTTFNAHSLPNTILKHPCIHTVADWVELSFSFVPFPNTMLSFGRLWTPNTLIGLGLGQFLSLLITSTGFTSSELAKKGFLHHVFCFFF